MPPFPWHFGGQRYQNIFVHADEIVKYCKKYNIRMCFDVSHTMLTCNHFKEDFYEYAKKIAPYTAHIHIGDATGVNGEGLQIGEGEIDITTKLLKKYLWNSLKPKKGVWNDEFCDNLRTIYYFSCFSYVKCMQYTSNNYL